jgi:HK97 gp10 family phage protein
VAILRTKVQLDLSGLKKLDKATQQRRVTLAAVKDGAKVVQKSAKGSAPRSSGALKQSLGIKGQKGRKGKTIAFAVVGPRTKVRKLVKRRGSRRPVLAVPAYYAHLVEQGTRPHALGKGSRAVARRGKKKLSAGAQHPGTRPRPFLRPAYTGNKAAIATAVTKRLGIEIEKEIAKAAIRRLQGKR